MISIRTKSFPLVISLLAMVLLIGPSVTSAQQGQKRTSQAAKRKPAPKLSLVVTPGDLLALSVKADKVPLKIVGAELSKKLKVPVLLGPSVENWEVTVDYKEMPLEPALQLIAPRVFIDYEVNQSPGGQPRAVGIYLNGQDDPDPAINAVVSNRSEAILFEGNTEDMTQTVTTKPEELRVVFEKNALTVEAKQQPLTVVAYRIASEIGIPLELKWETNDIIDVNFTSLPLEEAMSRLSPQVRLFVRANLQNVQRTPFRMVVVRPEKSS